MNGNTWLYRNTRKNTILSFWKKTRLSSVLTSTESVSSTNTTEQIAKDETKVEVLPVSHPAPKPAKKTYHSENLLDWTMVNLTKEIKKLEDVFHLQFIANSNETCTTLKSKKEELHMAIKRKNTLKVVSATFWLVCFLSINNSTCQIRKNVFLFHFKSSFCSWENPILEF